MLRDLLLKNRSYRRFYQEAEISMETLKDLIALSRITPSAANKQPLKYILSVEKEKNAEIFSTLAWAGYLPQWKGPEEGERPSAYIIVLGDTDIAKQYSIDPGITIQSILLGAVEKDYGGCIFASIDKKSLRAVLSLPERFEILYVIALGKPKETVVLDTIKDNDIKYWREENGTHHVPKRSMEELILNQQE